MKNTNISAKLIFSVVALALGALALATACRHCSSTIIINGPVSVEA